MKQAPEVEVLFVDGSMDDLDSRRFNSLLVKQRNLIKETNLMEEATMNYFKSFVNSLESIQIILFLIISLNI